MCLKWIRTHCFNGNLRGEPKTSKKTVPVCFGSLTLIDGFSVTFSSFLKVFKRIVKTLYGFKRLETRYYYFEVGPSTADSRCFERNLIDSSCPLLLNMAGQPTPFNVSPPLLSFTHRMHVWYIYLHWVDFHGKCW